MEINNRFIDTVKSLQNKNLSMQEESEIIEKFIATTTIENVTDFVAEKIQSDLLTLVGSIYPDPPVVIPMCKYLDYVMELTYWYPLSLGIETDDYDPEDIHDHFGHLVTKMLMGDGYEEIIYKVIEGNKAVIDRTFQLKCNMTNIIGPEYIHRIIYTSNKPSISIRVFLPNTKGTMRIYDKLTGEFIQHLFSPGEKRKYDFAGFLAALDKVRFEDTIMQINEFCLLDKSKRQIDILANI